MMTPLEKGKRHDDLTGPSFERGKQLSNMVYSLHEPEGQPSVEIVFIHGLQQNQENAYNEAYWTTWLARDGSEDNCWPATWVADEFPKARILSLSYDASLASMDLYILGESLSQEMVFESVNVGQNGCPVVYACHCVGGLVAKQIVVMAYAKCKGDGRFDKLLRNTKGFVFYGTPHQGSSNMPTRLGKEGIGRINGEFASVEKELNHEWETRVVAEAHPMNGRCTTLVDEQSARHVYNPILHVAENHFDVCRPKSTKCSSFLQLTNCIKEIEAEHELTRVKTLEVADYFVPVDTKLRELCEKLKVFGVVGLIGMGGIGKTTLSKKYFNDEMKFFDKCCYLEDVKSHGSIDHCLKTLLGELCDEKWEENKDAHGYILKIRRCIISKKVLVVIDDGTEDILKKINLLDAFQSGSIGSKVVITCRNSAILSDYVPEEQVIKVDGLDHDLAGKLFFHYAYHGMVGEEKVHFQEYGEKILKACGGLPLSIVVIGQYLRKQRHRGCKDRIELWKEALQKLTDVDSFGGSFDENLWKKLRISYDDLAPEEKGFFLDFACVLCDSKANEKWTVARIWDSFTGVQTLIDCSLIKVVRVVDPEIGRKREELVIHDQLRDMGRMIAQEGDVGPTRLWKESQVRELFEDNEGAREGLLEGLSIVGVEKLRGIVSRKKRKRFYNLRLLNLCSKGDVAEYVLKQCGVKSHNMRFLRVCDHAFRTRDLCGILDQFNGLRVLHMINCRTTGLFGIHWIPWNLRPSMKGLIELRELNLQDCSGLGGVLVGIGNLVNLEVLVLRRIHLQKLPSSVGNLIQLLELDLEGCKKLRCLPTTLGNLKLLNLLNLRGCRSLVEIPSIVEQLTKLECLDLTRCWKLECLPESLGGLTQLQRLDLTECIKLECLPESLGGLTQLQRLDLTECIKLECLPESLGGLTQLQRLDLTECIKLECLPESLGGLTQLQRLDLSWCIKLECLPESLGGLTQLQRLDLTECIKLECLPESLGGLTQLQTLDLFKCSSLVCLPGSLGGLTQLQTLDLFKCSSLVCLPESLGGLTQLQTLNLWNSYNLKFLPESLGGLTQLQTLDLTECIKLECLPESLGGLTQLQTLDLTKCIKLECLPESLGGLTQLQTLDLFKCSSLVCLPESLGGLTQLQRLDLSWCIKLECLAESLGGLTQLQSLDLRWCFKLECLPESLGGLTQLQSLDLMECIKLECLPESLGGLTQLQRLDLTKCIKLECLPESLGGLTQLQTLDLTKCIKLECLPESLGGLTQLQTLNLWNCYNLKFLPESLGGLTQLQSLDLRWCTKLECLPESLGGLTQLQSLDLRWCSKLECLPESLGGLTQLQRLDLTECIKLECLPESLGGLTQLERLDLWRFSLLECLPESVGGVIHQIKL